MTPKLQKMIFSSIPPIEVTAIELFVVRAQDGAVKFKLQVVGEDGEPLTEQYLPTILEGAKLVLAGSLREMLNISFTAGSTYN